MVCGRTTTSTVEDNGRLKPIIVLFRVFNYFVINTEVSCNIEMYKYQKVLLYYFC